MLNGRFSFLHISDLHFADESASAEAFRTAIQERLKDFKTTHCVVVSGDLFNRGSLSSKQADDCRTFLKGLPGLTKDSKILVVPGNHDLDRMARMEKPDGFNLFDTRKELVRKLAKNENFTLSGGEKEVLYKHSFQAFQKFAQDSHFLGFNKLNAPLDPKNYEVLIEDIPFPLEEDDGSPISGFFIRFVLLNTALIAGQSISGKAYMEICRKWQQEYQKLPKDTFQDANKAAELLMKISLQKNYYMHHGALTVDDGDPVITWEPTPGRLSLSKEGNYRLSTLKPAPNVLLTVFVGHHGYSLLSDETQKALKMAMSNLHSGLYLCGHAHEVRLKRISLDRGESPTEIEQFQAGRMFQDETNVTQHGFNYITFSVKDHTLSGNAYSHYYVQFPSGQYGWHAEKPAIYSYLEDLPILNSFRKENQQMSDDSPEINKLKFNDSQEENAQVPDDSPEINKLKFNDSQEENAQASSEETVRNSNVKPLGGHTRNFKPPLTTRHKNES